MSQINRLSSGGRIDRNRPLTFSFNGQHYQGYAGDTLAAALLANGVDIVGRSFKYSRARGIVAAGAEEPNAILQIGSREATQIPNVRATQQALYGLSLIHIFYTSRGEKQKNIHSMKKNLCFLRQSGSSHAHRSFIDQSTAGLALCGFWRYPYRLSTRLSRPFVGNPDVYKRQLLAGRQFSLVKPGAEAWQPTTDLASAGAFLYPARPLNDWDEIMLENTLERLETLVAELLQQNQALRDSHDQLQQQLRQATEENETLQLSMLEQEEKQSGTQARLEMCIRDRCRPGRARTPCCRRARPGRDRCPGTGWGRCPWC